MTDSIRRQLDIPAAAFRTIAVDFDGVIHQFSRGVHDGTCYDGPTPGALRTLIGWMAIRPVAVLTARPLDLVWEWFDRHAPTIPLYPDHGLHREYWDEMGTLLLTNRKIVAQHYIDDRAIRFGVGRRAMAADWEDLRVVVNHWDSEYHQRAVDRAMQAPQGAEPCN